MKTLFTPQAKQARKHLAQVIGTVLGGIKSTYLGAPSMAYQIGLVTLERDWTVTWPTDLPARDVDLIEAVATQEGYKVSRSAGSPEQAAEEAPAQASNEPSEESAGEAAREDVGLTLSFPTTGWDERTQANLVAMLASKRTLITKALDLPALPVEFTEDQVSFPWFTSVPEPEVAQAVAQLLAAMIDASKKASRVSSKPPAGGNEKYAMRCLLLRLGFIGIQYKTARKVLMGNLEGNAAWANPPAPQAPQPTQAAGVTA
ncbi:hypothetical protein [Actinomyces minihominis]|uniref:hypothetical protein n=1 Tax=Actinomyces minihominis TaxID=2002838 RepID=UPI000C072249|nr:hypothetical protein [Actinomyces minihominis]